MSSRRPLLIALATALAVSAPVLAGKKKPVEMPEFTGVSAWFNTDAPPTKASLRGKVVLVDFWTYSCINCIRTFPNLKRWYEKYRPMGFEIIGVHSPEFVFESRPDNVKAAIQRYGLPYPVAMDDARAVWNVYGTRAWPTHVLIDRRGVVREVREGEGDPEATERLIQQLLAEDSAAPVDRALATRPVETDFARIKTPEIYLGYQRLVAIGQADRIIPDGTVAFKAPDTLRRDKFYLDGSWKIEKEFASLQSKDGKIILRYEANKANMVLRAPAEVVAEVWVDGKPADAANKGSDVVIEAGRAIVRIGEARLYNLVSTKHGEHRLELRISGAGLEAYTFTFG